MHGMLKRIATHGLTHAILWAYLLYLCIIVLVVSPYANWLASEIYRQQTGRDLHFEAIHINPFRLSLTLRKASDKNPDGTVLWSVEKVYLDFAFIDSLLGFTPTIDELWIDQPRLNSQRLSDGQWNFSDILQHQANSNNETTASTQNDSLPALAINQLQITQGNIQFLDNSLKKPISASLDQFSFVMENFSTLSQKKQPYLLRATIINADAAKTPGELLWQGNLSLHKGFDQGTLAVKNILLAPLWPYTKSHFNFTLHTTNASMTGQYHLQWQNAVQWMIQDGQLQLDNIGLTSGKKSARNVELTATQLMLDNINISSQQETADIATVTLDGLHLSSWSDKAESGVIRAFIPNTPLPTTDTPETTPWSVSIAALAVNKGAIDWRVAELDQHTFQIRKLKLKAEPISFNADTTTAVTVKSTIDKTTKLSANGNINLNTLDGSITTDIQQFPLTRIKSLITPQLNIKDLSGMLDTNIHVELSKGEPTQIKTQGKLADLKLHPLTAGQELLTWENLAWENTQVDLASQKITIPLVRLSKLDGWLIISKEGKTNIQKLFPATNERERATSSNDWQFDLHKLSLNKASFRFHDDSLTPNFTAAVQNFSGDMTNLSSNTNQTATFLFNGDVDGYAPVKLQGKTQPFLTQPLLDAKLDFENMDLGGFSGYSSTYAGWRIERGLLTANLHYRLNDGLIEGDNHIEMDQLQLGERVRNNTAMDVPLRLALALITDENGIATLDIGVSGKTDDPNFNVSKVIWSAVRNTFKKIVKSPFKLLAKLAGTKEDLGELPFNSGSSKLLGTATRRLNALQEAMNKRPELRIELRGSYDPVSDTRGLQTTQINQILQDNGLSNQDIKSKNQRWQAAVAREYRKLDQPQEKNISADKMHEQLLLSVTVPAESLTQLAAIRSINAKQFLVQHLKIDNNRVLISASQDCTKPKVCNRRLVKIDLSDVSQIKINEISTTQ